jgi:IS6 family transposase
MMRADHSRLPFSISVDKNAAYPEAFASSQNEKVLPEDCIFRRVKYLNNILEQAHRFINKKVRPPNASRGFTSQSEHLKALRR